MTINLEYLESAVTREKARQQRLHASLYSIGKEYMTGVIHGLDLALAIVEGMKEAETSKANIRAEVEGGEKNGKYYLTYLSNSEKVKR